MASNKNITMKEFNGTDYDTLYPKTLDSQGLLTGSNITDYKVNTVGEALALIYNSITLQSPLKLKVLDPSGAVVVGSNILSGSSTLGITNSNGEANVYVPQGITSLTVQNTNGYANYNDTTIEIQSSWIGDGNYHEVSIGGLVENGIVRYTTSTQIKFSPSVKNVDACLVGGGGTGNSGTYTTETTGYCGGGSGGISNVYGITVTPNTNYDVVVGGISGTSSFNGNSATGGKHGGYGGTGGTPNGLAGGVAEADGNSNTTISEFDDGVTFYGGSGAGGTTKNGESNRKIGGTPYGGKGGYRSTGNATEPAEDATGYGGGGGGSGPYSDITTSPKAGKGYQGLVAIRVHYN